MQANAITDSPNGQYDNDDVLAGAKIRKSPTPDTLPIAVAVSALLKALQRRSGLTLT